MIHDTNELMDFENTINFLSPKSVSSGSYLIKCCSENQKPLFIQSPKCKSKQGFMKGGKKMYCDLVFSYEDESFLRWIEDFEAFCQKKLFENRSIWFDSDLELHDIENSFLPSLKIFKSKQHILRANIPLHLGKCALKIYDENEEDVNHENIIENSNLMTILEIQGIKCSSRSFQIEYEIKQMMLLNPVDIFEKCVFSIKNKQPKENDLGNSMNNENNLKKVVNIPKSEIESDAEVESESESESESVSEILNDVKENDLGNFEFNLEQKDLAEPENDICEIDLEIPSGNNDVLQLKKRNEVYVKMYKEAKKKARLAREFALSSYLEAKRIKNTYLFDEAFDSDDEKEIEEKSLENMKF